MGGKVHDQLPGDGNLVLQTYDYMKIHLLPDVVLDQDSLSCMHCGATGQSRTASTTRLAMMATQVMTAAATSTATVTDKYA